MSLTVAEKMFASCCIFQDVTTLTKAQRKWLSTQEFKQYGFLTDYYKDHKELPTVNTYAEEYDKDFDSVEAKPRHYLTQLQDRYTSRILMEEVPKVMAALRKNPQEAREKLITITVNAEARETKTTDKNYAEKTDERAQEYLRRKDTEGVMHLSCGHPLLDKLMLGYNPNDLITIGGRAGMRKTWCLAYMAILAEAVLPEEQGPLLFVTNEIGIEELELRMDAIRFRLAYGNLLAGKLNPRQEMRYFTGLSELKKKKSRLVLIHNCRTIDEINAKYQLYKPSLGMIDGSYLLEPQMILDYQKIAFITQNLKLIASSHGVPTLNTTQLKRSTGKGEKKVSFDAQDDFAFGNSYVQDSDIAFTMYQTPDMVYENHIGLQVAKGRRMADNKKIIFQSPMESMKFNFLEPHEKEVPTTEIEY